MPTVAVPHETQALVSVGPSPFVFAAMSLGLSAEEALALWSARGRESRRLETIDIAQSLFVCTGHQN
jgi:hypothetical protein